MNPPKSPIDLAPSTFARQRAHGLLPWSRLYAETVQTLFHVRTSDKAKLAWIRLQPILNRSEEEGYLIEDGAPMTMRSLARQICKTEAALEREIQELIEVRLLKKDGDTIYDPIMVLDKKAGAQPSQQKDSSKSGENEQVSGNQEPTQHNGDHDEPVNYPTVEERRIYKNKNNPLTPLRMCLA
jgi:hypothetical protein